MEKKHIDALTGGRFFAMMLIILSHFEFFSAYSFGVFYKNYLYNATLGVDYFFIISGFGMMLSALSQNKQPDIRPSGLLSYAVRHVKKVYPLYLIALLIGIAYRLIFEAPVAPVTMVKQLIPCLFLVQSATGLAKYSHAFCGTFWFLSSLFCIYLTAPLLIRFLKKYVKTVTTVLVALLVTVAISVGLVYLFKYIQNNSNFDMLVYASPYRRVWYVVYGMLLAILFRLRKPPVFAQYIAIPIAIVYFFLRKQLPSMPYLIYALDLFICGFAVFSITANNGAFVTLLSSKPLAYLGNLSMYVFILHYVLRMYLVAVGNRLHLQSAWIALLQALMILVIPYGIAALIHTIPEKTHAKR